MSNPDHIKNIHRINRIMGQLKGVEKMIVEKKYCMDILQQTRAATSAIKSLENNILNKHIDHCVTDAIKKNNLTEKLHDVSKTQEFVNSDLKILFTRPYNRSSRFDYYKEIIIYQGPPILSNV